MGLNPFGDESDSLHAWKERYKQQQFQAQTLQSQLSDLKVRLQDIQVKYEEVAKQLKDRENELSLTKQELREMKEVNRDKEKKILEFRQMIDSNRIDQMKTENKRLKSQIEDLQSQIARGSYSTQNEKGSTSELTGALIPLMLSRFDPDNPAYEDAYINLVETVIAQGDVIAQIIGILVKYGGQGPVDKLNSMISSPEFDVALEQLKEEQIITVVSDQIYLKSRKDMVTDVTWQEMETMQIFAKMKEVAEKQSETDLINALETFRNVLQEREIPLTTIFFEIRKMIERIKKDKIERDDVLDQIDRWTNKFKSLSQ